MAGNVQEWTLDEYLPDYFSKINDSTCSALIKPQNRHPRTLKGGSYLDKSNKLRSAERIKSELAWNVRDPQIPRSKWWNADAPFVGFRLVKPDKNFTKEEIEQFFSDHLIK
jgi:formylglycine-generating enzyme required for sulfatase activity